MGLRSPTAFCPEPRPLPDSDLRGAAARAAEGQAGWGRGWGGPFEHRRTQRGAAAVLQICPCRFSLSSALWHLSLRLVISGASSSALYLPGWGRKQELHRLRFADVTPTRCGRRGPAQAGSALPLSCWLVPRLRKKVSKLGAGGGMVGEIELGS